MENKVEKVEEEDPDKHYLGNIWGWKFSFVGLGIILFFLILAIARAEWLGVPYVFPVEVPEQTEAVE